MLLTSCLLFFIFSIWDAGARVFMSPCGLSQELYRLRHKIGLKVQDPAYFTAWNEVLLKNLDILTCIGGYHNFNTSIIRTAPDGINYLGLFGIEESAASLGNFLDDDILDDLEYVLGNVLTTSTKMQWCGQLYCSTSHVVVPNTVSQSFYSRICRRGDTRIVTCRLDNYVIGDYDVIVPKNSADLNKKYQNLNESFFNYIVP